jgi:D-arabinose 1-dehydrogenase-like Zn-dependent alcohol dehydrogenase
MEVKPPETIGIVGIGGLRYLAMQFAKALGYKVVAIDNRAEGRDLAVEGELKADWAINFTSEAAVDEVPNNVGRGELASMTCCNDAQGAITWSLGALRTRGELVELRLPVEHINFNSLDLIFEEKRIIDSLVSSKPQAEEMLRVVDEFNMRSHVTTVTLDQVPELPTRNTDRHLKSRLVMKTEA